MRKVKYLLLISLIFITFSCTKKVPKEVYFTFVNNVDVFSDVLLSDLIVDTNVELINDIKIDTTVIGNKNIEFDFKYNKRKYKKSFNINIKDKVKPFIYSGSSKTLLINNDYDFCDELIIGDNYDSYPKCEIIGSYNYKKLGTYDIKIKVVDQSGNEAIRNMKVRVVDKITPSSSTQTRVEFSDVINNHQSDNTTFGIDVSSWQKDVDYEKVKEAGATFVMIRLGYQGSVTKNLAIDSYYEDNIRKAKEAGLKVGVYLYTDASSVKEAKEHALWVIDVLGNKKLDLPVVFDWEDFPKFRKHRISLYELNEIANTFIETINNSNYEGMLYSSKTYLENFWDNRNNYSVWLAHYTNKTDYDGDYVMWQMTSSGRIPGVSGPVDINILYNK